VSCICTKNIYKFKPLPSWNFDCSNSWYQTGNLRSNKCWWTCKISKDSFFHALFEIRLNWNPEVSVTWVSWTVRNQVLANDATHHSCLFTVGVVTDLLNQRSKEFFLNYSVRLSHYGWAKVKQHKCSVDSCFWCVVKKLTTSLSRILLIIFSAFSRLACSEEVLVGWKKIWLTLVATVSKINFKVVEKLNFEVCAHLIWLYFN
jgi:hypothetical protein